MEMKRLVRLPMYLAMGAFVAAFTVACDDDDNKMEEGLSEQEKVLKSVIEDYINNSVVPTYKGLADAAIELSDLCERMRDAGAGNVTPDMVEEAGAAWMKARRYWELSEAWLFGAAADYNIDPHIDTWPLDKAAMDNMLNNAAQMAQMADAGKAAAYVGNNLGQGLLGFHAVEYMLFELTDNGNDKQAHSTDYTQNELNYLAAVAGDLRNQCVRLEVSWADEGSYAESSGKWGYLADAELEPTFYYGESMKNSGLGGSKYKSYAEAVQELLVGAQDIADEVGGQKIGNPIGHGETDDPDYIESPYSLNSIEDFTDNLKSIRTAYMGYQPETGVTENYIRPVTHSLSDYIRSVDKALDERVRTAIEDAISKIQKMKEPFAKTARAAEYRQINLDAQEACQAVNDILDEVMNAVQDN